MQPRDPRPDHRSSVALPGPCRYPGVLVTHSGPGIHGRADYRILIATARLVFAYTILGQLARDGAVELTDI